MILCECGEFIEGCTFKEYIHTSSGPSTPTIGHRKCGLILDFVDGRMPKRYSTKSQLKSLAVRYAAKMGLGGDRIGGFLVEVDRIKSEGNHTDYAVLVMAYRKVADGPGR